MQKSEFKWISKFWTDRTLKRLVLSSPPVGQAVALIRKYNFAKQKYHPQFNDYIVGIKGACDESECQFVFSMDSFDEDLAKFHNEHWELNNKKVDEVETETETETVLHQKKRKSWKQSRKKRLRERNPGNYISENQNQNVDK
jgi:hypothetical protein